MSEDDVDESGPAFPVAMDGSTNGAMTMRAYFAAKAMQGLLANPAGPIQANGMSGWGFCNCKVDDVADLSVHLADAMLAALAAQESRS